jgi:hypothetical protein
MASNLTLYLPKVLFFNIRYLQLTAVNSKQKKIKQKENSRLTLFFFSLSRSPQPHRKSFMFATTSPKEQSGIFLQPETLTQSPPLISIHPNINQGMFAKIIWGFLFSMNRLMEGFYSLSFLLP